ncbi:RHS repeat-associated protein [Catenulispora sp. GP43]|uniref:RHS repeat-associated core domain-containing protein n=1 Tax=Catenulispora sp. GP43 TaxID=3156263 RepID=UPI0035173F37
MVRPSGWDILGLDGDPTPGVVESVQALAKQFGDFAHDVEAAYRSLNSFGSDTAAMQWIGQTADAFKNQYGPLPGRLQKLYTSYSEASDALSAYAPQLQAAQTKADTALRQAQDAHADLQRATSTANNAASDLKTAQQNQAANPNQKTVTDAQTAHDTAQTNLNNAKAKMAALTKQANDAYNDRINAAKTCASALGKAQGDGIHNKSWWDHVAEDLSEWGGKIAEIANDLAPFLDVLALATSWIPGVDVITAALAEADNIIALVGTGMQIAGDAMQGHWGDALMGAGMLGLTFLGGKALGSLGGKVMGKLGREAEEGAEDTVGAEARTAEGNGPSVCKDDPIDVVSGWMLTDETDLKLPGVLPVVLRRAYCSGYTTGHLFGPGWSSTLDQRISINEAGIHFAGDDAQRLDYPIPAAGEQVVAERGARWPLSWDRATDEIRITDPWTGHTRHFATVHHRGDLGEIRDLTAISDRNGNRVAIHRDEFGVPVAVEHPGYSVGIDTAATAAGPRVIGIRLLDGTEHGIVVKQYRYDDRGRLTGVIDSSGIPYDYEWDDANRVIGWVDRVGYRYGYQYDEIGRVVRTSGDGGFMSGSFAYDDERRTTVHTSALGNTTTFRYSDYGHVVAETDPLGSTILTERDRFGRLLAHTDALGNRTTYERDERGDAVRVTGPDGSATEFAYNAFHQATTVRAADGAVWLRAYDERGNLVAVTDPAGAVTSYEVAGNGAPRALVNPLGAVTGFETDAAGLPLAVTDPLGAKTHAVRDAFGRAVAVRDPLGARFEYGWTVEGRRTWQLAPTGARDSWTYDAEGRLVEATDPIGGVTRFEPGPFGRIMARTGADGVRYEFAYDSDLRLVSVTNPAGSTWRYAYDAAGRLIGETDFTSRTLTYEHDAAGRLAARITGLGQRIVLEYDSCGRVTGRRTPDGDYSFAYDVVGRLTAARGPESALEYERDALGRVLVESVNGRAVHYDYDLSGRRVARATPAGAESVWSFDAAGRPAALMAGAGQLAFSFDASGRERERSVGAEAWLTREFDGVGRLTSQRLWNGDRPDAGAAPDDDVTALVFSRDWSWRADGVPLEVRDSHSGTRRFTSDPVGRVTAVSAGNWRESYAYDALGNLAAADTGSDGAGPDGFDIDRTLIRTAGRTSYEHDAAGRLVRTVRRTLDGRRRVWSYTWDAQDRLVETATPDGDTWRYRYDPLGRRTTKTRFSTADEPVEQVRFVWDGLRVAEQESIRHDGSVTALTWDYDPGTFRPAAQRSRSRASSDQAWSDEAFHAVVADLSGAPTELVGPDGRVAWRLTTSLFGRTVGTAADAGVECPLRFQGQYFDAETGLHYNLHRYYDPDTASYLTPDPLGLAPAPNDRAYVTNPLTYSDPLGLCGEEADAVADEAPKVGPYTEKGEGVNLKRTANVGDDTWQFNTGHAWRGEHAHSGDLNTTGLNPDEVEQGIVTDAYGYMKGGGTVPRAGGTPPFIDRPINVGGHDITYRVNQTPDGTYRVTTYWLHK